MNPGEYSEDPPPAETGETETCQATERQWQEVIAQISTEVRIKVADIVRQRAPELSTRFYKVMLEDPEATIFLNHAIVENRLGQALLRWLNMLFGTSDPSLVSASIAQQRQVGTSHARIKIPINLVCRGARYLKHWLSEYIAADASLDRDTLKSALIYIHALVDLAFETMNSSFVSNADRDARTDEAYRLFSLSQDLAIERERQRAALVEWNHLIMSSAFRRPGSRMPLIGHSEFGLWLVHKAQFMFDRSPEIRQIQSITERIDLQIVPQLDAHLDAEQISALFTQLDSDVSEIKFLLTTLFDRYLEVENGRDALTKLLNRRFLPSALMREIELAKKTNHKFTVMLIDIDHFKRVNDSYGHDTGDTVLQQIAALIMNSVRSGDFVFRYGGEEILVILVDVDSMTALAVAEKMRTRIGQTNILLSGGRSLNVTISIGLAAYDGHPDYRRIITRADTALYEAKNAGRNRSVFAD